MTSLRRHCALFLLALPMLALSAQVSVSAASAPIDTTAFTEPIRVACIGDSITYGAGAKKEFAYPAQLAKLLDGHWDVRNFGVSARTLMRSGDHPYWAEKAFTEAKAFNPNVVVILLGANDTKPHNWGPHSDEFVKDYADLIGEFSALSSKPRIYICRPCPVLAPGNYGINEETIAKELAIIDQLAKDKNLDLIDLHTPLLDKPQLLPDRVHPNADGYALLARTVAATFTGKTP